VTRFVRVADGRRLAYETSGDPVGAPVFLLHGTPGSRQGPQPRALELGLMGIRLVTYDRPGYGDSDRHEGRSVADVAGDVGAIADALGIDRFAVVGRSGGGPHALACAARLPDRVTGAAALVGLAPRSAEGLDWFAGMADSNIREHRAAWRAWNPDAAGVAADLTSRLSRNTATLINRAPDFLQSDLESQVPDVDRRILADPAIRRVLVENFRKAATSEKNLMSQPGVTGQVLAGWLDDALAFSRDWGFEPDQIDVPVLLWHGEKDVFSPVSHSRWLARHIPGSTLVIEPGSAHFGALLVLPSVLRWLRPRKASAPSR
jgi:pimeloyl-ACP methyl ester carboxylesterase